MRCSVRKTSSRLLSGRKCMHPRIRRCTFPKITITSSSTPETLRYGGLHSFLELRRPMLAMKTQMRTRGGRGNQAILRLETTTAKGNMKLLLLGERHSVPQGEIIGG